MSVPVFSNRASLSLATLDVMGDIVRRNEQTLKSMGAVRVPGAVRAAPAWYVPSPVAGVGSAVGFTCISPGTIGAVDISRAYQVPLIINGKLHLPMAHNHINREIDPEDVTVDYYPGAIDSIDVREGTPATLEHGTICLPLAESPTVETDDLTGEEYEVTAGWAGLLQAAEFTPGIDTPVLNAGILQLPMAEYTSGVGTGPVTAVAGALAGVEYVPDLTDPEIRSGMLRLPATAGGDCKPASFTGTTTTSVSYGGLKGAEYTSAVSLPQAAAGILQLPLASYGSGVSSVTGALAGVVTVSGITAPYISTGVLCLPPYPDGTIPVAEFTGAASGGALGGIKGGEFKSGIEYLQAVSGVLQIPLAGYGSGINTVWGAIAGVELSTALSEPCIWNGMLRLPAGGGALLGLQDLDGTRHTWSQVAGYAGGQVQVAGISLQTGANTAATFYLNAGIADGYLHFSLTG